MARPTVRTSRRVNRILGTLTGATPIRLGRRIDQLGRDLRMVGRRFVRGRNPSPVVQRPQGRYSFASTGGAAGIRPRPMRITEVVRETDDAVSIYLEEVDGHEMPFSAGQFMSVDVPLAGETLRRAYSLAGSALPNQRRHVTVKRVDGGRVSNYLNDHARAGQSLMVLGPSGHFTLEDLGGLPKKLVLIAGGSGITPIMSLASTVLASHPEIDVALIYGNRSEADVIFQERLEALASSHEGRFVVDHVLETPTQKKKKKKSTRGRLDAETTLSRLDALGIDDHPGVVYFVCGPSPMMDAVREALGKRGVPDERIREESFGRPEDRKQAAGATTPQPLVVHTPKGAFEAQVAPGETLLEAGRRGGADMPFSCAMGGCAACRVKLVSGEVAMDSPNCLSAKEREQGFILACVSRAVGPCEVEVS